MQRVLQFDPDNAEAKQMLDTVQLAEAEASGDWRWGWRIVDRNPSKDPRDY